MFRQVHDLSHVIRVVHDLAVDGLQHGMRFAVNGDRAAQVVRLQRVDRLENQMPILLPRAEHFFAFGVGVHDKFAVAIAVGLFAVAGQEAGKARAHVARQVLHHDGHAVGLSIGRGKKLLIRELGDGVIGKALVAAQAAENFVEVEIVNAGHKKVRLRVVMRFLGLPV